MATTSFAFSPTLVCASAAYNKHSTSNPAACGDQNALMVYIGGQYPALAQSLK